MWRFYQRCVLFYLKKVENTHFYLKIKMAWPPTSYDDKSNNHHHPFSPNFCQDVSTGRRIATENWKNIPREMQEKSCKFVSVMRRSEVWVLVSRIQQIGFIDCLNFPENTTYTDWFSTPAISNLQLPTRTLELCCTPKEYRGLETRTSLITCAWRATQTRKQKHEHNEKR